MSEAEIQKRSIKPLAKIIAFAQSGIEPEIMGMGPVSAVKEVVRLTILIIEHFFPVDSLFSYCNSLLFYESKSSPSNVPTNFLADEKNWMDQRRSGFI